MKIILSRKGFDSSSGGVPSPILPDGRIVSLPIPDPLSPLRYGDIGRDIGCLASNLTRGRIRRSSRAHLDPDLVAADRPRHPQWRPIFGQAGAAQGHLARQGVGPGDVFVFFGLFRRALRQRGRWVFDPAAARRHVIWGWLRIAEIWAVDDCGERVRQWAGEHPHFARAPDPNNTVYLAASKADAGVFERVASHRVLTHPDSERPGLWRLPEWFRPRAGRWPLSYHRRSSRWQPQAGVTLLEAVSRGQEFVLDTRHYPEARCWLDQLLDRG